ncbi:hypothetical protein JX265_013939 [Neoarthrinium moseri]|uniref:Ankyrin repeat protein n=1 Tax=Neoarthrinium moseri TaxID=1658444 RepID=A0A9P9W7K0_9PEZI|nr:hypothetical protein JX265_013939 [Neoarthrinium moseri]
MATKSRTHDDYTVGWICPLEVEQIAALEMLDEEHPRLPQSPSDHNVYNLGSIAGHNVVMAGLHHPGNNPAATVVTQMRMTFPKLRFGLLVGIGGGVPVKTDNGMIRLGDVVVSKPAGVHSGAVQYDHGKARAGCFERTGALASPPTVLLNAAQDLAAKRARSRRDPIEDNVSRIDTSIRGLRRYKHPGIALDQVYQLDYTHKEPGLTCGEAGCHPLQRISRVLDEDEETYVVVHRGTVASGELVVKDAMLRDTLASEHGVLCFETEAAGALADFPCLVIRGISDYCDSHKNDVWHGYAAATAAAYARQLFFHMPVDEVKRCITQGAERDIQAMRNRQDVKLNEEILHWLTPIDYGPQHSDYLRRRQPGTGQWLLDCETYQKWVAEPGQTLFCPGIPGAGKTILTSIVVDNLEDRFVTDPTTAVAYIYFNFNRKEEQRLEDLMSSLLKQLAQNSLSLPPVLKELHERHAKKHTGPTLEEISTVFRTVTATFARVFVIVDALDECQAADNCRARFLHQLLSLQAQRGFSVFATSRHMPDIEKEFSSSLTIEIRASEEDIGRYLKSALSRLPGFIAKRSDLQDEITQTISRIVDGMFLLAQLYCDTLMDKDNPKVLRSALQDLTTSSRSYEAAYDGAMKRIEGQLQGQAQRAKQVLAWITCAQRPLTKTELQHALAVEIGETKLDEENITQIHDMVSVCAGLITVDEESNVIRLVHYTTQKYFEGTQDRWFPAAHSVLASTCTTYLSFEAFADGRCQSDQEFEDRLERHRLYEYAARHWGDHARVVRSGQEVLGFLQKTTQLNASAQAYFANTQWRYPEFSQRVPSEMAATHLAAIFGLGGIISAVLNERNKDARDSVGRTPLSWAAENGHIEVVKLLLETEQVEVDSKDNGGQTPLSWAAENGHIEVAKLLLKTEQVDVDSKSNYGRTPLSLAAWNGRVEVVKLLLETEQVEVDSKDNYGRTPLSWAAWNGHIEVVKLLLETEQVEVDSKDNNGRTPLWWTARAGSEPVVTTLLSLGANPGVTDRFGLNALQCVVFGDHESVENI